MKPLIAPAMMRESETRFFRESGVKSIDVMERAAQALADAVSAELPAGSSLWFACGTGGNGGDGTACARLLCKKYRCSIIQPREPKSPDAIENLRRARECGIPVHASADAFADEPDAWVDALFGTGLSRAPEGAEASLIERINASRQSGAKVFSADIPSGLNGATGKAYVPCVRADRTVTFQYLKTGLVLADGLDVCGALTCADVGFPENGFCETFDAQLIEPLDLPTLLPARPRNIHKGDCGHLLIIAGSFGMAGAAAMCAKAALRSGAGLVSVACVKSIVPILQTLAPQAMCVPLDEENGAISVSALPAVTDALRGKDAAVIGPGLTRRVPPEILHAVLESGLPTVVDADALNLLSANREMSGLLNRCHVLTPHPGEARRLIPDLDCSDPIRAACRLAGLGASVLLKGAASVIAGGGNCIVSRSGCCGMARGGSGDILSGILGAFLAGGEFTDTALAAAAASEIHGLAGERAQRKYGSRAMNAADIAEFLPEGFPR